MKQDVDIYFHETSFVHPLAAPQWLGKQDCVTAYVEIPEAGAEGMLACTGGEFGGWSLFVKGSKPHVAHFYLKTKEFLVSSEGPISAKESSASEVRLPFTPDKKNLEPAFSLGTVERPIDSKPVRQSVEIQFAGKYSTVIGYG